VLRSVAEIVVVTRPTELAALRSRFVTDDQVRFYIKRAKVQDRARRRADAGEPRNLAVAKRQMQADLDQAEVAIHDLVARDEGYSHVLQALREQLDFELAVRFIDRSFLANFDFGRTAVVVVVGQDGLVANTAKYVGDLPLVAVNPDPDHIDGILLPFAPSQARGAVERALQKRAKIRQVTLAEVQLNDGQRMLAFNDFFIGSASHVSARYNLEFQGVLEPQSSSGVLVSTGAGSTGWFSSVINMARGVAHWQNQPAPEPVALRWEDRRLAWAVREPFLSKSSGVSQVAGFVDEGQELILESMMPSAGVIFSDGIEADFLQFNSGAIARIFISRQRARLVVG
jgi:NAD kinase